MNDTTKAASDSIGKIVGEAESLLDKAGDSATREANSAMKKAAEKLRRAQEEFLRLEEAAIERAKVAARATDNAVHEHPYTAVGVAAAIGLLLGVLISRR